MTGHLLWKAFREQLNNVVQLVIAGLEVGLFKQRDEHAKVSGVQ
jgi:hypothetical protein